MGLGNIIGKLVLCTNGVHTKLPCVSVTLGDQVVQVEVVGLLKELGALECCVCDVTLDLVGIVVGLEVLDTPEVVVVVPVAEEYAVFLRSVVLGREVHSPYGLFNGTAHLRLGVVAQNVLNPVEIVSGKQSLELVVLEAVLEASAQGVGVVVTQLVDTCK